MNYKGIELLPRTSEQAYHLGMFDDMAVTPSFSNQLERETVELKTLLSDALEFIRDAENDRIRRGWPADEEAQELIKRLENPTL